MVLLCFAWARTSIPCSLCLVQNPLGFLFMATEKFQTPCSAGPARSTSNLALFAHLEEQLIRHRTARACRINALRRWWWRWWCIWCRGGAVIFVWPFHLLGYVSCQSSLLVALSNECLGSLDHALYQVLVPWNPDPV